MRTSCPELGAQGPPLEITEEYDEALHGPLDAPMVPSGAAAERRRFGPPRDDAEAAAIDADLRALREFTSAAVDHTASAATDVADGARAGGSVPGHDRGGLSEVAEVRTALQTAAATADPGDPFSGAPDSDDEDAAPAARGAGLPRPAAGSDGASAGVAAGSTSGGAGAAQPAVDEDALEAELRRLEVALDAPESSGADMGTGTARCVHHACQSQVAARSASQRCSRHEHTGLFFGLSSVPALR